MVFWHKSPMNSDPTCARGLSLVEDCSPRRLSRGIMVGTCFVIILMAHVQQIW